MRLVAGALALTLFASLVSADDARPPDGRPPAGMTRSKVPLRVVRVMPESRQALLFDRNRSTHVLAEVGGKVEGYEVESIDEDEVTLRLDGREIVLVAPVRSRDARSARDTGAVRVRSAIAQESDTAGSPVDPSGDRATLASPYASPVEANGPVDPYGEPAVRVVQAPGSVGSDRRGATERDIEPGEGGVRVVQAPADGGRGAPRRDIEPGSDGVRVVAAPGRELSGSAEPSSVAGPSGGQASGAVPGQASGAVPGQASGAVPGQASGARIDTTASTDTTGSAPERAGDSSSAARPVDASTSAIAPASPVTSAGAMGATRTEQTTSVIPGAVIPGAATSAAATKGAETPSGKARRTRGSVATATPPRSAAEKQADDARAMADVLSFDSNRGRRPTGGGREGAAATVGMSSVPAGPASSASSAASAPAATEGDAPRRAAEEGPGRGEVVLARSEVDGALGDFAMLTTSVQGRFTASGVVIEGVGDGSMFQRVGLRAGDVVTAVNGMPLRSLDDAANLYARAAGARGFTAQVVRGGKAMVLHVAIR